MPTIASKLTPARKMALQMSILKHTGGATDQSINALVHALPVELRDAVRMELAALTNKTCQEMQEEFNTV